MKRTGMKTADDVLVDDPDAAMRRTEEAVRRVLALPKPEQKRPAKGKRKKKKK